MFGTAASCKKGEVIDFVSSWVENSLQKFSIKSEALGRFLPLSFDSKGSTSPGLMYPVF